MRYENELNILLQGGNDRRFYAAGLVDQRWRLCDDRRRAVRNLANGAVGLRLVRIVLVERLDGRKTNERRQSEERGKAHEPFHSISIAVQTEVCQ